MELIMIQNVQTLLASRPESATSTVTMAMFEGFGTSLMALLVLFTAPFFLALIVPSTNKWDTIAHRTPR